MKEIGKIFKTMGIKKGSLMILLIVAYSLSAFIPIRYIQRMIDGINISNYEKALMEIIISGILYMIFQFLSQFLYATYNYYSEKLQNEFARDMRITMFGHLLSADELKLKNVEHSKLSNGIIEDTQYISENYYKVLVTCIVSVVNFVIGFVFMTSINLYLSLLIIPLGMITSFCANKIEAKTEKNVTLRKEVTEKTWKLYSEGIRGIKNIRVFDRENRYYNEINTISSELCKINTRQSMIEQYGGCIIGTFYMFTIAIIMLVSAIFVLGSKVSFGGLLALVMYNHMLVDPLLNLIEARQNMIKLKISVSRLENVLTIDKLDKEVNNTSINQIKMDNISFAYDTKKILSNFNAIFEKGKKYCIVGKTGTGKSTLLNLITGYLTPDAGSITIVSNAGTCYENMIPERISYMLQGGYLFNTSIKENIRFANPIMTQEQLDKLVEECCLKEVCERVTENVGDDGELLSGGERKRVQLAICLAKSNSDVIILDELSSSLDKATYVEIMKNISKYFEDKIVIFVEHYYTESEYYDEVIKL